MLFSNPGATPAARRPPVAGGLPQTTDRPLADPFGITFGQDGAYWVAEFAAGRLARVTTDGEVTTLGGLPTNSPREITTGPGNTLWVSLELSNKVARITGVDPPRRRSFRRPTGPAAPPLTPPAAATDRPPPSSARLRVLRRASGPCERQQSRDAKVSMTLSEAATRPLHGGAPARRTAGRRQVRRARPPGTAPARSACGRRPPAERFRWRSPAGAACSGFSGSSRARAARSVATAWWPSRAMRPANRSALGATR